MNLNNLGIGFNPIIIKDNTLIPNFIDFVECGPEDLKHFESSHLKDNISVHIARSPMCDDDETQDNFLDAIKKK